MAERNTEQRSRLPQNERRRRWLLAQGILLALLGSLVATSANSIADAFRLNPGGILVAGFTTLAVGVGALLQLYLRGDLHIAGLDPEWPTPDLGANEALIESLRNSLTSQVEQTARIDAQLSAVVANLRDKPRLELPGDLRHEVKSLLQHELAREATAEALAAIAARSASDTKRDSSMLQLERTTADSIRRLTKELESLDRRGRLNLIIGVLTTTTAVGVLIYLIVGAQTIPHSLYELLAYYVPRLSIAIFIEVFAFFFLRLYKATLLEIKFYQNELTNLGLLTFALHTAVLSDSKESIAKIAELMARADRNQMSVTAPEEQTPAKIEQATKLLETVSSLVKK
jgi:hypothetical protein